MVVHPVPQFPVFEETFASMTIPGSEGFAVCMDTTEERLCLSFGQMDGQFFRYRLEGDPLRVVSEDAISMASYQAAWSSIEGLQGRNGMVASNVLDGQSYMVKVSKKGSEFRFVLCNPEHLDVGEFQTIGRRLSNLFRDSKH